MPYQQLFKRWTYEPLPTNISNTGSRRDSQRRALLVAILFLCLSAGLILSAKNVFSPVATYSPLDNYQNM
jgi:hypothetical protein